MSMLNLSRLPLARRRDPKPAARRRPACFRPLVDSLEDRIVLSQAVHAAAQVHVLAAAAPQLSVPVDITGINVTNVTRNATSGVLTLAGTATGTILGQAFTTPLVGSITPAKGAQGTPILELNLQPIHLSLLGLNVDTSDISLNITAHKNGGVLGSLLGGGLTNILGSAASGTTQSASQVNTLLNNQQLLGALNENLAKATPKLVSATPGQSTSTTILNLSLGPVHLNLLGLSVKLDNGQNGPITVKVSSSPGAGLLGDLLSGITGGTKQALKSQVATALHKIDTTSVPVAQTSQVTASGAASPSSSTSTASASNAEADPVILTLTLNPIDLNLLGLEVKLYGADATSPVTVTVSAQPGSGELLGNLLSTVGGLLNTQGVSNALNSVLGSVVSLANGASLSVNGQTAANTYTNTTTVLDAYIAPVHLNLLGAEVDTSPINLQILAHSGNGLVLGNIVAGLAGILDNPKGNIVKDAESGLTNLLNQLNQMYPTIGSATTPAAAPAASGSDQILSLTVPPIDLNLLGLILQTSTIQVNATAQSGNGNLLGNLLYDLLNSAKISQTDLNTINTDLNGVLAKVVGILNQTTLNLASGAVGGLSSTLQELTSSTLINTSDAAIPPQQVLDLSVASNNNTPPVDVDLLGVVVTTSNIEVQLLAQPGDGQILGNLVYNVSHLLDGGLLSVLGILNTLGV